MALPLSSFEPCHKAKAVSANAFQPNKDQAIDLGSNKHHRIFKLSNWLDGLMRPSVAILVS
jgi:hypothetical protein